MVTYIKDTYDNHVVIPGHTGLSDLTQGQIFAIIEGQVTVKTLGGDRLGPLFRVTLDNTVLFYSRSYNAATDYCVNHNLTPVDCTTN
jgi:hypothetical protein